MRRTVVALTLAASTLTATPSGLFHPLWSLLSTFCGDSSAEAGHSLKAPGPNTKEGPGWDPSGRSLAAPPASTDAGPGWDPSGSH